MYNGSDYHLDNCKKASVLGNQKIQILKQDRINKYNENPKKCKFCDKPLDYNHRKKTFCNSSCAASYNNIGRVLSEETKRKIGDEQPKPIWRTITPTKLCPECKNDFKPKRKNQIFCSKECALNNNFGSEISKEKIRQKVKERIENGTFSGWKSRINRNPSYPEKYFIDLLNNENIIGWTREHSMDKYFIDFAFIDKKIALEIDGKQHEYKDRKEKDIKKDEVLKENGWNVFRIKWYNPINDINKGKLYKQIEEFKNQYVKNDRH